MGSIDDTARKGATQHEHKVKGMGMTGIKILLGSCCGGLLAQIPIDPVSTGGQLAKMGMVGFLCVCVVVLVLALVYKDKQVRSTDQALLAVMRETLIALAENSRTNQALADSDKHLSEVLLKVEVAARDMTASSKACSETREILVKTLTQNRTT